MPTRMSASKPPAQFRTTRRRIELDEGRLTFLHVHGGGGDGPRNTALVFVAREGRLVLRETSTTGTKTAIMIELSSEELDALTTALVAARARPRK